MGDFQGALNASRKARKINIMATGIGIVSFFFYTLCSLMELNDKLLI
jgi:purine-nucleoside phosphorylase